ncbi:22259_t:CDS:2 [Cetraspora pellucida]|uniref:22259_t:CDS:1 n=1 Tax=Cetraspora pellucida TaxID=1433469 RepID=A0A9N9FB44_9GLOM|nr:22259_t:CDS:2 [Cetraspora pellucida]
MSTQQGIQFFEEVNSIDVGITTIQTNIDRIQELESKIVISTTSTQEDEYNKERSNLMDNTKHLLLQIKDRIKKLESDNTRLQKSDPNNANISSRTQQHLRLHDKFNGILNDYRGIEDHYMRQQKDKIIRQYRVANPQATQEEIENYVSNSSNQPVFAHAVRTGEARNALAEVKKRHGSIKKIESTITELVSLVQEMELTVTSQDPIISDIETSVEKVTDDFKHASHDLEEARKSSLGARKKKWIFFGIIAFVILIIIAIIIAKLPRQTNVTTTVPANNVVVSTVILVSTPSEIKKIISFNKDTPTNVIDEVEAEIKKSGGKITGKTTITGKTIMYTIPDDVITTFSTTANQYISADEYDAVVTTQ